VITKHKEQVLLSNIFKLCGNVQYVLYFTPLHTGILGNKSCYYW